MCGSLAVVHARVGDAVGIAAEGAWHMVVTVKAKKHLASGARVGAGVQQGAEKGGRKDRFC